jgi:broad specificity phosphatase PhoE
MLWLVRHGESAGNVARDTAEATGMPRIDIPQRDIDVPLSPLGERQARALGRWIARLPEGERPTLLLTSPYLRARTTSLLVLESAGIPAGAITLIHDERLREREFGILDGLTKVGIEQRFPEQAALREAIGKFYHRPPGGESWCDVILRLRSVIDTITREFRRERLLIVCHQVIVFCFRYLLERMTEEEILAIDRAHEIANCAVTAYRFDRTADGDGRLALSLFNFVAPLEEGGAPITSKPDHPAGPK